MVMWRSVFRLNRISQSCMGLDVEQKSGEVLATLLAPPHFAGKGRVFPDWNKSVVAYPQRGPIYDYAVAMRCDNGIE
jgi:hypothetical protein